MDSHRQAHLWPRFRFQARDHPALSTFGKTLKPVIAAIATWGETHEQEIRSHLEPHDVAPQEQSS